MASEAKINGNNEISFMGWFKVLVGLVTTFIMATTAYAYVVVLPKLTDNIIENDKLSRKRDKQIENQVTQNRILISELVGIREQLISIKENQQEFKDILKRTAPYERRDDKR